MTVIPSEIERFNRLSATWWNKRGPMRPLHVANDLRLCYGVGQVAAQFGHEPHTAMTGLQVLDIGCGGGLLSEPLARLGAHVVGVDTSRGNIAAAQALRSTTSRPTPKTPSCGTARAGLINHQSSEGRQSGAP